VANVINILHLSDLHFTKKNKNNENVVFGALLDDLTIFCSNNRKPDVVVISGDLANNCDEDDLYYYLYDELIEPLEQATSCSSSRFIISPGNHDISRSETTKLRDLHEEIWSDPSRDRINQRYTNGDIEEMARRKSAPFFDLQHVLGSDSVTYSTAMATQYTLAHLGLQITAINSAWLGGAGLYSSDLGRLAIPESLLTDLIASQDSQLNQILITHHPLDWLGEANKADVLSATDGRFQLHLFGHVHDPRPQYVGTFRGSCLANQGGALYPIRDRYIGYSFIRIDLEEGHKEVSLRSYSDKRRQFHVSEELVDKGTFYPSSEAKQFFYKYAKIIDREELGVWRLVVLRPHIVQKLNDGIVDRPLSNLFVAPPIYTDAKYKDIEDGVPEKIEDRVYFSDTVKSDENFLFLGRSEYGKTTLIKQFALSILMDDASHTVPVILDFASISPGNEPVLRLLRQELPELPDSCRISQLLEEGLLCILIDDLDPRDSKRYDVLKQFVSAYPRNQFIFTANDISAESGAILAAELDLDLPITVTRLHIKPLRRQDMRSLVEKWDADHSFNRDDILERLINEIRSINLPVTAVNGTILLSIFENQANFKPINRAVLIEQFIETLLEKRSPAQFQRGSFDFTNKVHFLSHVARQMATKDQYLLEREELRLITRQYLDELGLIHDPSAMINEFIDARIFTVKTCSRISFRYRAFLEYFIARAMQNKEEFRNWVLSEDRYLSYVNEIQYYAGLVRTDYDLLEMVAERFLKASDELFSEARPDPNSVDHFTLPRSEDSSEDLAAHAEAQINAPPLTAEEKDALLDAELPHDPEKRQEVFRPAFKDNGAAWLATLIVYSHVLKNLELIPDEKKKKHLARVLNGWAELMVASLWIVPKLATERRMKVNGVMYEVNIPKHLKPSQTARLIYLEIPTAMERLLYMTLGTEKLAKQLSEEAPDKEAQLNKLLRAMLCADLRVGDWLGKFGRFTDGSLNAGSYILQAALWKLKELYAIGNIPDDHRPELQKIVAEGIATLRGGSHLDRARSKSDEMQRLRHKDLLRRLTTRPDI
jgi:predicted MPP superfamily phosphohydrolase